MLLKLIPVFIPLRNDDGQIEPMAKRTTYQSHILGSFILIDPFDCNTFKLVKCVSQ